jgi:hypothetical protein
MHKSWLYVQSSMRTGNQPYLLALFEMLELPQLRPLGSLNTLELYILQTA